MTTVVEHSEGKSKSVESMKNGKGAEREFITFAYYYYYYYDLYYVQPFLNIS